MIRPPFIDSLTVTFNPESSLKVEMILTTSSVRITMAKDWNKRKCTLKSPSKAKCHIQSPVWVQKHKNDEILAPFYVFVYIWMTHHRVTHTWRKCHQTIFGEYESFLATFSLATLKTWGTFKKINSKRKHNIFVSDRIILQYSRNFTFVFRFRTLTID